MKSLQSTVVVLTLMTLTSCESAGNAVNGMFKAFGRTLHLNSENTRGPADRSIEAGEVREARSAVAAREAATPSATASVAQR